MLKPMEIPEGDLVVCMTFAMSNSLSDIDNPVKPFLDILQKYYGFDDKRVVEMHLYKMKVSKGDEWIYFDIDKKADF